MLANALALVSPHTSGHALKAWQTLGRSGFNQRAFTKIILHRVVCSERRWVCLWAFQEWEKKYWERYSTRHNLVDNPSFVAFKLKGAECNKISELVHN